FRARPGGSHVERRILSEHPFRGRTALAVVMTDEEHPNGTLRRDHEFGYLTSMDALARCAAESLPAGSSPFLDLEAVRAERHLRNMRQLTFGGENAEAYFGPDGKALIFQSTRDGYPCDQIYTMRIDGSDLRRVSTGAGRTTCGYFYPGGKEILFASTHRA